MIKINKKITFLVILVLTIILATAVVSASDSNSTIDTSSVNSVDDNSLSVSETTSNSDTNEVKYTSDTSSSTQEIKTTNDNEAKTTSNTSDKQELTSTGSNTIPSNKNVKSNSYSEESKNSSNEVTINANINKDNSNNNLNENRLQESNYSPQDNSVNSSVVDSKSELKQDTTTATSYSDLKTKVEDSTYSQINLNSGNTYSATSSITVDRSLTINGNGATINGKNFRNIFNITSQGSLTLENIIITNGRARDGGAIYNEGNLTVNNSTFTNNNVSYYGGAIANFGGTVLIQNSIFKDNYAKAGGALSNYQLGHMSVINCTISNNDAKYYGGAIFSCAGPTLTINNTMIFNNSAQTGGAIYGYNGKINATNTTFTNNSAIDGGAIFTDIHLNLTIINSSITNNVANNSSGAIYNYGNLTLIDSDVTNNTALLKSGAIHNYKSNLTVINSTINQNKGVNGGAIYNTENGTVIIINSTLNKNNVSENGGSIYNSKNGTVQIINSTLNNNTVSKNGGVIYNSQYGSIQIINSTLNNNTISENGGVIYNSGYGEIDITNSTLNFNSAKQGGVIYNELLGNINLTTSELLDNHAKSEGNTIYNLGTMILKYSDVDESDIENRGSLTNIFFYKTTITLHCNTTNALIGDYITIYGDLKDEKNNYLSGKTIILTIGSSHSTLRTDINGNFYTEIIARSVGEFNYVATYEGSSEYGSSNATCSFSVTEDYSTRKIVVDPITTKNGYDIILTATITNAGGIKVDSGQVTFKLNGVTLKVNGTQVKVNVTKGIAQYTFTVPNYSAKEYNLTAVYGYLDTRLENSTTLTILKSDPELNLTNITSNGNTGKISGMLLDEHGVGVDRDTKVSVKLNGKTIESTRIYNGVIDITFNTSAYKTGIHNLTVLFGENGCYNTVTYIGKLAQNTNDTIVVDPVTGKNGDVVSFKTYVIDKNGNSATSGSATFKLNGVTLKENGTQVKVKLLNGVAEYNYTIPNYSAKDYNITAVASVGDTRYESKSVLTIYKTGTYVTLDSNTIRRGYNFNLTGQIRDIDKNLVSTTMKIAVKVDGITVLHTEVYGGMIRVEVDMSSYSVGNHNVTVVVGENNRYFSSTATTKISIRY